MNYLNKIRETYKPFHPISVSKNDNLKYSEVQPDERLSPFILHYWELKTNVKLENGFLHKVIPNGCIDIYFEVENPANCFITGLSNKSSSVKLNNHFRYIGICFVPTAFSIIYKVDASELCNQHEKLACFAKPTSDYISNFFDNNVSFIKAGSLLNAHFLDLTVNPKLNIDKRLSDAVFTILKSKGQLRIETDLNVGISPRQLRRLFEIYVGDSPKSFAQTIRFQSNLKSLNKLKYYDFGYYDQAHFIKDFKKLYGSTPNKFENM